MGARWLRYDRDFDPPEMALKEPRLTNESRSHAPGFAAGTSARAAAKWAFAAAKWAFAAARSPPHSVTFGDEAALVEGGTAAGEGGSKVCAS